MMRKNSSLALRAPAGRSCRWWRVTGHNRFAVYELGSFLAATRLGALNRARREKASAIAGLRLEAH